MTTEFDVTVELLDHGYRAMQEHGPLRELTDQYMYFETGQGSEFSYGKHGGIDMTTAEALALWPGPTLQPVHGQQRHGLHRARTHRDDFEMILANLQDHFMGKLLGLPMGMAPMLQICISAHRAQGQQMATQLLTAAGASYFMDVALNTDRMLAYFDTSAMTTRRCAKCTACARAGVSGRAIEGEFRPRCLG